jgi:hypothetical protein
LAENPVRRFARLLGGVVLMQGRLGHQVLGQLLVADAGDAVLAGAMMVITGTARQRNIVAQAAVRTAAPTLAAQWFLRSKALHIQRREAGLASRELKQQRIELLKAVIQHRAGRRLAALEDGTGIVVLTPPPVQVHVEPPDVTTLRKSHQRWRARAKRLSSELRARAALPAIPAAPAAAPRPRHAAKRAAAPPPPKPVPRPRSKPAKKKPAAKKVAAHRAKKRRRKR